MKIINSFSSIIFNDIFLVINDKNWKAKTVKYPINPRYHLLLIEFFQFLLDTNSSKIGIVMAFKNSITLLRFMEINFETQTIIRPTKIAKSCFLFGLGLSDIAIIIKTDGTKYTIKEKI